MFLGGPRLNTVFRNRWRAIWFSAIVLLTAYCTVPSADETASPLVPPPQAAKAQAKPKAWWAVDDKPAAH